MVSKVNVWEENILIPTYNTGKPDKNPMFFEKRVYQGSSGVVYPYPVIEKIEDTPVDKQYRALFLENEYLKIMILPELGGRVQMAYDKIKERHFVYYNHVIKPALVGLAGPWISGGIEFNWPQHHRPSTYLPVDYTIEECADGSAVIWVSERERMFHQKGMAGFTLRPGKAFLEIQGKLYNPTPFPQTFLWWANPAVAVNDEYQSVFPADVNAVFDHGKRDVSSYPIATGNYYKMDYSAGVDISRYKNIPVPTSFMAIRSGYDFVGGYENDTKAGVLHVANHHISPGKKQWTWGHGDFGRAWDRNLTDTDGPYIELMTGVYTDNQPDFTWLQPYEEKTFTQYFLPYRELGVVKNATTDILMNLEIEREEGVLKLFATSLQENLTVEVKEKEIEIFRETVTLSPENIFITRFPLKSLNEVSVSVKSTDGKKKLVWRAEPEEIRPIPEAAKAALLPKDINSIEELYLTGLHLEQYRHATYLPTDYYLEALRREPGDVRNNNAMGLWLIRKGQFAKGEGYLRQAVKTMTERNPNPYDGEPLYNLGLSLKYQEKKEEAYEYFYKACWNAAWQDAGYYSLAQLSAGKGNWEEALYEIDKSLLRNWHNHRGRHLKAAILRHMGRTTDALRLIEESLEIDRFNFGCLFEKYLLLNDENILNEMKVRMRTDSHNYLELVIDYTSAYCWEEALQVLEIYPAEEGEIDSMSHYYKAWILIQLNREEEAGEAILAGENCGTPPFFPNLPEAILALQSVCKQGKNCPKALYLSGNIWYDKRQYAEAIEAWEQSANLNPEYPTVLRNLALAYYNKENRKEEASELMEKAFRLDTSDARILMELDQLSKRMNRSHTKRLEFLETYRDTVLKRDDLYLEYVTLLNQTRRYREAIQWIGNRKFHPWEGGEGKVPAQYQIARLELAKSLIKEGKFHDALKWIDECYEYPENLGEGKLYGAQENDFDYYKGCILESLGKMEEAKNYFEKAAIGISEPAAAIYYNDQKPHKLFYQGLALRKMGNEPAARSRFNKLISYGEKHLYDTFQMDYFAVSLPDLQIWEDDMDLRNRIHCNFLMALGHLGLGNKEKARIFFEEVREMDINHQDSRLIDITLNDN